MFQIIKSMASRYAEELKQRVERRTVEMEQDDTSHYLLYRVLGVMEEEGRLIDLYQNKGRFLYKYAGSFLEEAAVACIKHRFPQATRVKIPNPSGGRPKTFEIDCLVDGLAHEIKWRDATTDGDHITKEHTRVRAIRESGYVPVRVMFYYPQRLQAMRIQETLETLYQGIGGSYYCGDRAWAYIKDLTNIDLLKILEEIANVRG
ncbi:MAG: ApaLI family restriction endonuclease [Flavonifractor sp.]|jgi:hypothetical protein|nr:ApaLI family restriction endonuclease [Flavonifractor sp.]MCI9426053.1 ApaLI family restriction endonuclease [Flavonifractor sp.]MCI9474727.1 ApaLI family restriction endonuclease [Flavonifractor sp.]